MLNKQVNFDEVAKECEIVSKGAAYVLPSPCSSKILTAHRAKRYERLLKAHGIHPSCFPSKGKNAKENGDSDAAVTPTKRRAASTKGGTPKTPVKKTKKEIAIVSAEKIVEKAAQNSMIKVSVPIMIYSLVGF